MFVQASLAVAWMYEGLVGFVWFIYTFQDSCELIGSTPRIAEGVRQPLMDAQSAVWKHKGKTGRFYVICFQSRNV